MKKIISAAIAAVISTAVSAPAFAILTTDGEPVVQGDIMLLNGGEGLYEITRTSITGEPVSVKDGVLTYKIDDVAADINIEGSVIFDSTGNIADAEKLAAADKVIMYMRGPAEASDITPSAIVIDDGEGMFDADIFKINEEGVLVNEKNTLALNIEPETELARLSNLQEGIAVDGPAPLAEELDGLYLIVFYTDSTRSIPAMTTPSKIIACNDDGAVTGPGPVITDKQFAKTEVKITDVTDGKFTTDNDAYKEFELDGAIIFDIDGNKKTADDIKAGDELIAFQNKAKSAVNPEYVVIKDNDKAVSVDADKFSVSTTLGEFVDTQNGLALTIADDTPIVDLEGKKVAKEDIADKCLMVFYDKITMSIPGITNPIKVIVLDDTAVEPEYLYELIVDKADILNQGDMVYVPVRKYAESLGLEVKWFGETRSVQVGTEQMGVKFTIGEDKYDKVKMTPFALNAAPQLVNDTTYVPVSFFEQVLEAKVNVAD